MTRMKSKRANTKMPIVLHSTVRPAIETKQKQNKQDKNAVCLVTKVKEINLSLPRVALLPSLPVTRESSELGQASFQSQYKAFG